MTWLETDWEKLGRKIIRENTTTTFVSLENTWSEQLSPLREARRWARWGRGPSPAGSYPRQRRRSQLGRTGCVAEMRAGSRRRSARGAVASGVRDARPSPESGGRHLYWRQARLREGRERARSEMLAGMRVTRPYVASAMLRWRIESHTRRRDKQTKILKLIFNNFNKEDKIIQTSNLWENTRVPPMREEFRESWFSEQWSSRSFPLGNDLRHTAHTCLCNAW